MICLSSAGDLARFQVESALATFFRLSFSHHSVPGPDGLLGRDGSNARHRPDPHTPESEGNGGARRNGTNLKGGPTVSCRVGSLSERVRRQLDPALKVPRSRSLLARTARPDARSRERRGETVRAENPSVRSGVRPWNGRAREGFLRGRHVRSTCRRSVRPAIHVPSRGSPRSSSTGEPSDPPFGALHSEFDARERAYRRFFQQSSVSLAPRRETPLARTELPYAPNADVRSARGFMNRT